MKIKFLLRLFHEINIKKNNFLSCKTSPQNSTNALITVFSTSYSLQINYKSALNTPTYFNVYFCLNAILVDNLCCLSIKYACLSKNNFKFTAVN